MRLWFNPAPIRALFCLGAFVSLLGFSIASQSMVYTPGKFGVSPTGAATYTVQLAVPPGTAGMVPTLGLVYNSQGGNGLLGMGWSLSGLSAVTRCPETVAQDGVKGGINFDANDRFCLDGQRLIAVSGISGGAIGTYGADGTEYRTEKDSFSRIISHGIAGSGPAWFEVHTKAGLTMEYGNTASSQVLAQGKTSARVWALDKVTDTAGNYMTVAYQNNDTTTGDYYPLEIDYTGNAGLNQNPYNAVKFIYATRPDVTPRYLAGSLIQNTQRLMDVMTYAQGALVKDYKLTYDQSPATQRSRLTSLQECDATTTNCLQPTVIGWQSAGGNANPDTAWGLRTASYNTNALGFQMADVNGDGLPDVIYDACDSVTCGRVHVLLNTGKGTFAADQVWGTRVADINTNAGGFQMVDLNGDGMADYVYDDVGGNSHVMLSNGSSLGADTIWGTRTESFNPNAGGMQFADVNGDGRPDLVYDSSTDGSYVRVLLNVNGTGFGTDTAWGLRTASYNTNAPRFRMADVNGDGLPDLTYDACDSVTCGRVHVLLNTGKGTFAADQAWGTRVADINTNAGGFQMLDLNGDGMADYVYDDVGGNSRVMLSNGSSLGADTIWGTRTESFNTNGGGMQFADVNGDGRPDLIYDSSTDGSYVRVLVNVNGTGFGTDTAWGLRTASYNLNGLGFKMSDINGDGIADLIYDSSDNGSYIRVLTSSAINDGVSLSVTNGLGSVTSVVYKPLTDGSVYTKGSGAVYPQMDFQGPLYVVSSVSTSDGVGGSYAVNYSYGGARIDLSGRGFLGFATSGTTDPQSGISTTTSYLQNFPCTGLVSASQKLYGSEVLNTVANSYMFGPTGTALSGSTGTTCSSGSVPASGSPPQSMALVNSVESSFELNGGALVTTVTTNSAYDGYGNPTSIAVSTGDGYSKTTANTYLNDTTNWFLGRLTRSTVTSTTP